jgi:hypothetical protein
MMCYIGRREGVPKWKWYVGAEALKCGQTRDRRENEERSGE